MLTLLVLQGPDKGRRFELPDAPAVLGRDSRQIPLTDNTSSRRHAELLPKGDGSWVVRDLGSSNGTFVNGAKVTESTVKVGDQIRIGRTLMVFGSQPGVSRASGGNVSIMGEDAGLDAAIMHTVPSNDDSMILAVPEPSAAAVTNLKALYQLGAVLGSSFDVQQVLEVVMDLVFEHVKADRGIILLIDPARNELVPRVVRTRDEHSDRTADPSSTRSPSKGSDKIHASRTIINHVVENGEGVLSSNAMADRRFSKGKSVHDLGIRSALCVPIKSRRLQEREGDEVVGVIYVDSSVRNYTYAPDQLRLLAAIGLQAGLAVQNAQLYKAGIEAERLAAIGETTAALSHSIKNILQAMRGGADVVEMGLKGQNLSQSAKGWRIVERNLDRIFNLTMNLLAYSRPREPNLQAVNPRTLIEECVELVATAAAAKGAMVVADVPDSIPAVPMDPDGIHQVVMNLLSNALDAVEPQKGLIRCAGRYRPDDGLFVLEVIDNGVGIPEPMMRHMFELFHSTKGNRGTGLGLAVTRKIVEEHDGSITVASVPGQGATFTVKLPVRQESLSDPQHTHGPGRTE